MIAQLKIQELIFSRAFIRSKGCKETLVRHNLLYNDGCADDAQNQGDGEMEKEKLPLRFYAIKALFYANV